MPRFLYALFFVACATPEVLEQAEGDLAAQRMTAGDFDLKPRVDPQLVVAGKGRSMGMLGGQEGEPGAPPPVDGNSADPVNPPAAPPVDEEKPEDDDDVFAGADPDSDGDGLIDDGEEPAVDTGDSGDTGDKED